MPSPAAMSSAQSSPVEASEAAGGAGEDDNPFATRLYRSVITEMRTVLEAQYRVEVNLAHLNVSQQEMVTNLAEMRTAMKLAQKPLPRGQNGNVRSAHDGMGLEGSLCSDTAGPQVERAIFVADTVKEAELEERSASGRLNDHLNLHEVWRPTSSRPVLQSVMTRPMNFKKSTRDKWVLADEVTIKHRNGCIFSPQHRMRMAWDVIGVFLLVYDVAWIPLQVFSPSVTPFTQTMEGASLTYWTMDIACSFIVGYYDRSGNVVMEPLRVAIRYVQTWFFIDLIIVTFDWFSTVLRSHLESFGLARVGKIARIARVTRALRLVRLLKLRQLIFSIKERINSEHFTIVLSMWQNLATLIVINHFVACSWYMLGTMNSQTDTWVTHWVTHSGIDIDKVSFTTKYLISLHWSLTQFTPASMEVMPRNAEERTFTVLVLICGMIVFSSFVSSITAAMTRLRNLHSSQAEQFYTLGKFLSENRIPSDLSARLTRYLELVMTLYAKKTSFEKVELLKYLSGPLRVELQKELHEKNLIVNPFFFKYSELSVSCMSQLCYTAITVIFLSKGDRLFHAGTAAKGHMFFLTNGTCFYKRKALKSSRKRVLKVEKRAWFCEGVLWVNWMHQGTMRALVESEMEALDGHKFCEVTTQQPEVFDLAKERAMEFLALVQKYVQLGRRVYDIPEDRQYTSAMNSLRVAYQDPQDTAEDMSRDLELEILDLSDSEGEDEREVETEKSFYSKVPSLSAGHSWVFDHTCDELDVCGDLLGEPSVHHQSGGSEEASRDDVRPPSSSPAFHSHERV